MSKFRSQLLAAAAAGRGTPRRPQLHTAATTTSSSSGGSGGGSRGDRHAWLWPFVRCGTSAQIMLEAGLMALNSSAAANDNERWPLLVPSAADIIATAATAGDAVATGGSASGAGAGVGTELRAGARLKEPRLCTIERECVPVPAVFDPARTTT